MTLLVDNFLVSKTIKMTSSLICDDVEEIELFLNRSIKLGCEGLMVKSLEDNSTY